MTAERDIAGFALPFAAAVTAAVSIGSSAWNSTGASHTAIAAVIPMGAILVLCALMHPRHMSLSDSHIRILIALLGIFTGLFCAHTASLCAVSSTGGHGLLTGFAIGFGERMQAAIDAIPFKDAGTAGLVKALITGERADIPREVTEAFRDSGASHILSLSGMHLGIIYGIMAKLLGGFGNSPAATRLRSVAIITFCGFYTLATGASPSIVRAFIFILLGECARLAGRYRSTGSILFAALLIQLTANPLSASSVGFQLSYAAMAGIAFIYPYLKGLWPESDDGSYRFPAMRWVWNSAAMSISCQLTTGPIAYAYFGTFPQYFLLTNLIAVPLTGIIIPAALLTLVLSVCGICPAFLVQSTEWLATLLTESLGIIAVMQG